MANGEKRAYVKPSKGLRQGDPLSPYLFLLVADVLSRLLTQGLHQNLISGIKIRRSCPTLSHLFFADDAILFLNANKEEGSRLMEILDCYSKASGQTINLDKS